MIAAADVLSEPKMVVKGQKLKVEEEDADTEFKNNLLEEIENELLNDLESDEDEF